MPDHEDENGETQNVEFYSFVDYNDIEELGIDMRNIRIHSSPIISFLTKNSVPKGRGTKYYECWMNLLIIDPYNHNPQSVHFRPNPYFGES